MFEDLSQRGFECRFVSHAGAILERDFPAALADISSVLVSFDVPITEIVGSGGGETKGTQRMRKAFADAGWKKKQYEIKKIINNVPRESISHEVDHVKPFANGEIALEIEWNNKDPFFDRDLENFKRLHSEGAISLGVIVTRGTSLHESMREFILRFAEEQSIHSFQDLDRLHIDLTRAKRSAIDKRVSRKKDPVPFATAWRDNFVSNKYGEATTHWKKLTDRIQRGVGNPCPLLLIGLPSSIISFPTIEPSATAAAIEQAALDNPEGIGE
ncbi:MAG TPA: BglII/BstYI family type II restriction endonuclease [Acidobacteriaceae bacterium]